MPQEPTQERAESSFNIRFLTVDGKPLTVVGSADAIASLEKRLQEAAAPYTPGVEHERQ
jgi:hypothetical protein